MLRAVTHGADGREVAVVGLTEENWRLLASKPVRANFADLGLNIQLVVFRARDTEDLKAKAVELGLADESILATPPPPPTEPRMWRRQHQG
jgi:hypothetical protein